MLEGLEANMILANARIQEKIEGNTEVVSGLYEDAYFIAHSLGYSNPDTKVNFLGEPFLESGFASGVADFECDEAIGRLELGELS